MEITKPLCALISAFHLFSAYSRDKKDQLIFIDRLLAIVREKLGPAAHTQFIGMIGIADSCFNMMTIGALGEVRRSYEATDEGKTYLELIKKLIKTGELSIDYLSQKKVKSGHG